MAQNSETERTNRLFTADEIGAGLDRITGLAIGVPVAVATAAGIIAHLLSEPRIDGSFFAATSEGLLAFAALVPAGYGLVATRPAARLDRGRLLRARPIGPLTVLLGVTLLVTLSASLIGINTSWGRPAAAIVFALTLLVALWSATLIGLLVWQVSPSRSTRYAVGAALSDTRVDAARESIVKELRDLALAEAGRESMDRHALHERVAGLASIAALLPREQERLARFTLDELAFVAEETVLDRDIGTTIVHHLCDVADRSPHLLLHLRERAVDIQHKAAEHGSPPPVRQALEDALCTRLGPERLTLIETLHALGKAVRLANTDPSTASALLSERQLRLVAKRALVAHSESRDDKVIDEVLVFALSDVDGLGELDDPRFAGQLVRELLLRSVLDGHPRAAIALTDRVRNRADVRWNGLARLADTLLPYLHNVLDIGLDPTERFTDDARRATQPLCTPLAISVATRLLWLQARDDGSSNWLDDGQLDRVLALLGRLVDDRGHDACAERDAEFVHRQTGWLALQALGGIDETTPSGARVALGLLPVLIASGSAERADQYATAWLTHLADSLGPARVADSLADSTAALFVRVLDLARLARRSADADGTSHVVPDDSSDDLRAITFAEAAESTRAIVTAVLGRDTRGPSYLRPTPADRARHRQFRRWLDRLESGTDPFVVDVARSFDGATSTTWTDAASRWYALHAWWSRARDADDPELRSLSTSVVAALPSVDLVLGHQHHEETSEVFARARALLDWLHGRRAHLSAAGRNALDAAIAGVRTDPRDAVLALFERIDALPSDPKASGYKVATDRVTRRIDSLPTSPLALALAADLARVRQSERKLSFDLQSALFEWFVANRSVAGAAPCLFGWLNLAARRVNPRSTSTKAAIQIAERLELLTDTFCELLLTADESRPRGGDGAPPREVSMFLLQVSGALRGVRGLLDTSAEQRVAARISSTLLTIARRYPTWARGTELERELSEAFGQSSWWEDVVSLR